MIYVLAPNNVVQKYPYSLTDLRLDNPSVSFPYTITDADAAAYNTFPVVETPQPSYDPITQNLVWANPILEGGVWVQQWSVAQATPEEVAQREAQAKQQNKQQASTLLYETDWTTIPDVANPELSNPYLVNTAEFVTYRNQLRQIAVYPPVTVDVWPTKPQEVWATV
jgi:hypothetical protein